MEGMLKMVIRILRRHSIMLCACILACTVILTLLLKPANQQPEEKEPEPEDESYFTETLAKIYVKQQRYSKALEIIKKLNLKYPKKNAYFADQIRFLEKLIINTKSK